MASIFETLSVVNVNNHVDHKQVKNKKTGKVKTLSYLQWSWAWQIVKKYYPLSYFTIYKDEHGWIYHTDGRTAWVETGVTVVDTENNVTLEHIEYLPVMDYNNYSMPLDMITSRDVNDTIQRSITKAIARHGLGVYLYSGEDNPNDDWGDTPQEPADEQPPMSEPEKIAKGLGTTPQGTVTKSETMGPIEAVPMDNRRLLREWAERKGYTNVQVGDMIKFLADEGIVPDAKSWPNMDHERFTTLIDHLDAIKGGSK